jgi:Uncharacterized low-complexity proteins
MTQDEFSIPNSETVSPTDIHSNTDLSGADLTDADLSYANLSGADLSDADLTDTTLSNANLLGVGEVDFSDATEVPGEFIDLEQR